MNPTRRQFLVQSLAGAGALAGFGGVARAIEPVRRVGGPFFKFSLAAYGYRDLLTKKDSGYTLEDFVRTCAELELEGTELTSYYFPKDVTPDYLRRLKQLTFELGLDISGTAVGNDFCEPAGKTREEEIAGVKRWIDYADIMGAPVIRIFSGSAKPGQKPTDAHRLAVEAIEECCHYAGQHGVFLALENHGGLTATVDGMLALVRDVKSPWFGVNLDTGNFNSADVYGELAKAAPYALNVQVKLSVHPQGAKRQPSDFKRLAAILREANYRGYVVLEYEEKEDPRTAVPRALNELRAAFA